MCLSFLVCSDYETGKVIQIPNVKLGIISKLLFYLILGYVLFWVFVYAKQYQVTDVGKNSVITKVQAVGVNPEDIIREYGSRVWDTLDLVSPPLEQGAIFIPTNLIITERQTLSTCGEDAAVNGAVCMSDDDCVAESINNSGNGMQTGICLKHRNEEGGVCEIHAWCPLQNNTRPYGGEGYMFPMVSEYTILIKNHISFERFGVHRRNILPWATKEYIQSCLHNQNDPTDKYCPIFKLGTILDNVGVHEHFYKEGGVIGIAIRWYCDLDWDEKWCNPEYTFSRLDEPEAKIAPGFNFRYARYYRENGVLHRDLIQAYGIRIIITAYGEAGKFHINPFTMNFGSGLGLLSLVGMISDFIAFNLLTKRDLYARAQVEIIHEHKKDMKKRRSGIFKRRSVKDVEADTVSQVNEEELGY